MTTVRVYVNGRGVDADAGGTVLDAVRAVDPALAADVASGRRALTDSRGLPVGAEAGLYHGAIYRVVGGRAREASDA
jgi:hypothetical protein